MILSARRRRPRRGNMRGGAMALALAPLLLGCQEPAPLPAGGKTAGRPQVAENSFLLRVTNLNDLAALRAELAHRNIPIRYEYSDAVGLAGTVNVRAQPDQIQGLISQLPYFVEAHADHMRYLLDSDSDPCGNGMCDASKAAGPVRQTTTCSADCGVPPIAELQPELTNSWQVGLMHAAQAWSQTRGAGIDVAVFDTGYDRGPNSTHPDKPAYLGYSYSFALGSPDFSDIAQHGTHVVGIVAAAQNGYGAVGVAPDANLHMFQVFTPNGTDEPGAANSDLIAATEAAIRNNYNIISMSLGGPGDDELEHNAVRKAYESGLLIVVAAGNDEDYPTAVLTAPGEFPGAYPESMSVGATDNTDTIAPFSSQGSTVTVSAPGVNVYSSVPQKLLNNGTLVGTGDIEVSAVFDIAGTMKPLASASPAQSATNTLTEIPVVNCGYGLPADTMSCNPANKVALIERGPPGANAISFQEKVFNATMNGAIGVILYNHDVGDPSTAGTLLVDITLGVEQTVPVATLANGDGLYLAGLLAAGKSVKANVSFQPSAYSVFSGTSMATPATAGVAALVWSRHPELTNVQLRQLLAESAVDLGPPGRDDAYGWGRVDAMRALNQGAPHARCGDGKLDIASEICDSTLVGTATCSGFGWDDVPGVSLTCNSTCTSVDPSACQCVPGRAAFVAPETVTMNVTADGMPGALAKYVITLNGNPVSDAYVNVAVSLNGKAFGSYTVGPSDSTGTIEDFEPYDTGQGLTPGNYVFAPVVTKGAGRCHPDLTEPTYIVPIKG